MSDTFVTLSDSLVPIVGSVLYQAGLPHCPVTWAGIALIVSRLARYEEEGKQLYPKILITSDFSKLKKLLTPLHDQPLGSGELSISSYQACLKRLAPLAINDWYIYIERRSDRICYGLVRSASSILAASIEQHIQEFEADDEFPPVVLLRSVGGVVQAMTGHGTNTYIAFSGGGKRAGYQSELNSLADCICSGLADDLSSSVKSLIAKTLTHSIERGHGSLVVVIPADMEQPPEGLRDGEWLPSSIDLATVVHTELFTNEVEAPTATRAMADIVTTMLMSDGITVFDTAGRLRAYRVFARAITDEDRNAVQSVIGGARTRTFELLNYWTNSQIIACLMVSQDGDVRYAKRNNTNA